MAAEMALFAASLVALALASMWLVYSSSTRHERNVLDLAKDSLNHMNARSTTEKVQAESYAKSMDAQIADLQNPTSEVVDNTRKVIKDKYGSEYDLVGYEEVANFKMKE